MILGPHSDEGGLDQPIYFMPIFGGQPATIPCRLTNPNFTMMLLKNGQELQQSATLTFDPRTGFHIFSGSREYAGPLICYASYEDYSDEFTVVTTYMGKRLGISVHSFTPNSWLITCKICI